MQALLERRQPKASTSNTPSGAATTMAASSTPSRLLDGTTAGHAKAAEITRALLRAIFEAVNAIDPNDNSPATVARRAKPTLAGLQRRHLPRHAGGRARRQAPDGSGNYRDKNVIGKVLRVGDKGYRKLDQPPPQPIERSAPPAQPYAAAPRTPVVASPAVAPTAIAKPSWAQCMRKTRRIGVPTPEGDRRCLAAAGNRRCHPRGARGHSRRHHSAGDPIRG